MYRDVGFEVDEEVEVEVGGLAEWNVDAEVEDEVDDKDEVEAGGGVGVEADFGGEVLTNIVEESEDGKVPVLVYSFQ